MEEKHYFSLSDRVKEKFIVWPALPYAHTHTHTPNNIVKTIAWKLYDYLPQTKETTGKKA